MLIQQTIQFFVQHPHEVLTAIVQQIYLVAIPIVLAVVIAVPLTILSTRYKRMYPWIIGFSNAMQTIPSLALLVLMITIGLGIGMVPSIVALLVYALMPIVRNTYVGIMGVASEVKDAAIGMGATKWQLLFMIELPLALRVIIAGIRSSLVATVGFATLAALVGAGGLGQLILQGLSMASNEIVLAGTIPAVVMAFLAEFLMGRLEKWLTPKGIRAA